MAALIGEAAYLVGNFAALTFVGSLLLCKRPDLSWLAYLAAGPMILVRPREFFRKKFAHIPPILFLVTMLLFLVDWFSHWFAFNW